MTILFWLYGACIGLYLTFLVFLGCICRWEKHMVWPFLSAQEEGTARPSPFDGSNPFAPSEALSSGAFPAPTPAAIRGSTDAAELGFTPLGTLTDGRGSLYRLRADVWLASERDVLALIIWGKLAGIPHRTIRLRSVLADGRRLVSINDRKGTSVDLTGETIEGLDPKADLVRLLAWHRRRAAGLGIAIAPHAGPDPIGELRAYSVAQVDKLERAGLIHFLDPGRTTYRYGTRGALIFTTRLLLVMFRRNLWPDTRRKLATGTGPILTQLGKS